MRDSRTKAGRGPAGRWPRGTSGNPKGRAPRETEARYLELTLAAISVEDWRAIVERTLEDAKAGDAKARAWLTKIVLGDPAPAAPAPADDADGIVLDLDAIGPAPPWDPVQVERALDRGLARLAAKMPRADSGAGP